VGTIHQMGTASQAWLWLAKFGTEAAWIQVRR
jgi:hypothetical protein